MPILAMRKPFRLGEIIQAVRIKLSIPLVDVATRSGIEPTTPETSDTGMSSKEIRE